MKTNESIILEYTVDLNKSEWIFSEILKNVIIEKFRETF